MMRIAENIKDKRTENGLTQQEVADKLFVTRQCISRWEQGKTVPDIHSLEKLALIYNCDIKDLLDDNSLRDLTLKSVNKTKKNKTLNHILFALFWITLVFSTISIIISLNKEFEEYHINGIITAINEEKTIFTVTKENSLDEYTFDTTKFKDVTFLSKVSNSIISNTRLELNDTVEIYFTKDITSKRVNKVTVVDKQLDKNFMGIVLVSNGEDYNNLEDIPSDTEGVRYYFLDQSREDTNLYSRHRIKKDTNSDDKKRISLEILYDNTELINDIKIGLIYETGIEYVDSIAEPMLRMPLYIGEHSFSDNLYRLHSYELTIQINFTPVDSFNSIEIFEYDENNALIQSNTYTNYNDLLDHTVNNDTLYAYMKTSTINQNSLESVVVTKKVFLGEYYEVYSSDSYGFVTIYNVAYN